MTPAEPGFKWWDAFNTAMQEIDAKLIKTIFPGNNFTCQKLYCKTYASKCEETKKLLFINSFFTV